LKNSFAMGGLNTALVISSKPLYPSPSTATRRPLIRAIGRTAAESMRFKDTTMGSNCRLDVGVSDFESFTAAQSKAKRSRWSRFDVLTRLTVTLAAGLLAVSHADDLLDRTDIGLFVATERGPARSWNKATEALQGGAELDADIVPNLSRHALVANVAELMGLKGPTTAFYVDGKDGGEVLDAAVAAIESECASAILAIEVDESMLHEETLVAESDDQYARGCFLVADGVTDLREAGRSLEGERHLESVCSELASNCW
jgi:3-oxoacyl-(acyl-carrier-protein) synthase